MNGVVTSHLLGMSLKICKSAPLTFSTVELKQYIKLATDYQNGLALFQEFVQLCQPPYVAKKISSIDKYLRKIWDHCNNSFGRFKCFK